MKIEYSYRANSVNTINTGIYKNNTIQFKDNLNNIKDSNTMSQSETFAINERLVDSSVASDDAISLNAIANLSISS